jgi:hypothetical protein
MNKKVVMFVLVLLVLSSFTIAAPEEECGVMCKFWKFLWGSEENRAGKSWFDRGNLVGRSSGAAPVAPAPEPAPEPAEEPEPEPADAKKAATIQDIQISINGFTGVSGDSRSDKVVKSRSLVKEAKEKIGTKNYKSAAESFDELSKLGGITDNERIGFLLAKAHLLRFSGDNSNARIVYNEILESKGLAELGDISARDGLAALDKSEAHSEPAPAKKPAEAQAAEVAEAEPEPAPVVEAGAEPAAEAPAVAGAEAPVAPPISIPQEGERADNLLPLEPVGDTGLFVGPKGHIYDENRNRLLVRSEDRVKPNLPPDKLASASSSAYLKGFKEGVVESRFTWESTGLPSTDGFVSVISEGRTVGYRKIGEQSNDDPIILYGRERTKIGVCNGVECTLDASLPPPPPPPLSDLPVVTETPFLPDGQWKDKEFTAETDIETEYRVELSRELATLADQLGVNVVVSSDETIREVEERLQQLRFKKNNLMAAAGAEATEPAAEAPAAPEPEAAAVASSPKESTEPSPAVLPNAVSIAAGEMRTLDEDQKIALAKIDQEVAKSGLDDQDAALKRAKTENKKIIAAMALIKGDDDPDGDYIELRNRRRLKELEIAEIEAKRRAALEKVQEAKKAVTAAEEAKKAEIQARKDASAEALSESRADSRRFYRETSLIPSEKIAGMDEGDRAIANSLNQRRTDVDNARIAYETADRKYRKGLRLYGAEAAKDLKEKRKEARKAFIKEMDELEEDIAREPEFQRVLKEAGIKVKLPELTEDDEPEEEDGAKVVDGVLVTTGPPRAIVFKNDAEADTYMDEVDSLVDTYQNNVEKLDEAREKGEISEGTYNDVRSLINIKNDPRHIAVGGDKETKAERQGTIDADIFRFRQSIRARGNLEAARAKAETAREKAKASAEAAIKATREAAAENEGVAKVTKEREAADLKVAAAHDKAAEKIAREEADAAQTQFIETRAEAQFIRREADPAERVGAVLTSLNGWSSISMALFGDAYARKLASDIDRWFSGTVLSETFWESYVCYEKLDAPDDVQKDGVAFIVTPTGLVQSVAGIQAERGDKKVPLLCTPKENEDEEIVLTCPKDLECKDNLCYAENSDKPSLGYQYKITWGVTAPADEALTPYIEEGGVAVKFNIYLANEKLYPKNAELENGKSLGAKLVWYSPENHLNKDACIKWVDGAAPETKSREPGIFEGTVPLENVCFTVQETTAGTVDNDLGSTSSGTENVADMGSPQLS